ncbi:MAG TPA: DUF4157 domain-containing protein [Gaiellaceae bacterium]|nr:DUF4157 domain-containing protein [Gaiellaceae bacterium]
MLLQRRCACGGTPGRDGECAACKAKRLQRQASMAGPQLAPPIVHDVLRSQGHPLDSAIQGRMEARFGHDFSRVRVHTDDRAAESARAVGAHAYTVGRNVVFDSGRYAPASPAGADLLAHELTHVVQQRGAGDLPSTLPIAPAAGSLERDAEAGRVAPTAGSEAPTVARQQQQQQQPAAPAQPAQVPGCALGNCSPGQRSSITDSSGDVQRAIGYVDRAVAALGANPLSSETERLLRWYFASASTETRDEVVRRLGCIRACLVDTATNSRFGCDLPYDAWAYVQVGSTPLCADAQVPLCYTARHFHNDPVRRAQASIHECAHRVGLSLGEPESTDDIYADTIRFRYLSTETALLNADSFALFAEGISEGGRLIVLLPGFVAGGGPAVSLTGGETTWHVRFAETAEFQHPVLGMFSPTLGLAFTVVGEPVTPQARPGSTGVSSFAASLLAGVRISNTRPGGAGGGYVTLFGGPALSVGEDIALGAEAGFALGYRWRWLDLSAGYGYLYSPAAPPGMEHVGLGTVSLSVTPFTIGGK